MNLLEAAFEFADHSGRIKTEASRRSFLKVMRHLNKWAGGSADGVPLGELTDQDLTDWCNSETVDGRQPAPSTIRKRRAHVRSLYSWAKWKGYVETDPASQLDWSVQPGSGGVRKHTWLDEDTAAEIIGDRPDTPAGQRDQLIVLLGMMTGLRAGVEMVGLRWDQLSPDLSTIEIVGKGRKMATVGVPPQLRAALEEWRLKRPAGGVYVLPRMRLVWNPGDRRSVWMTDWEKPLGYDGILQAVKRHGDRHGVKLRPHDLRRSFASILEAQGVQLNDISLAMRHENVATTSRYLDRNPAKAAKVTSTFQIGGK